MKIAIISHSPQWTTGFGITCRRIAESLSNNGNDIICFSLGELEDCGSSSNNVRIWPTSWPKAFERLHQLFTEEQPESIIINFDIKAVAYFIRFCKLLDYNKSIYAHIVIDGFPVYEDIIRGISTLSGIIVPTKISQAYLRRKKIKNVYYAPHGVDLTEFFPISNKSALKKHLCLTSKRNFFLVGVFAKNEERKQIHKTLLALKYLIFNLGEKDIRLYLHTQTKVDRNKGWDLEFLVYELKLTQYVIFPSKTFSQDKGISQRFITNSNQLNYVERINMCDLIVNVPFSGGFELCNIEAQACGVPLITINDDGNIKEVVRESAMFITPAMTTIWGNGAWIHLIDEKDLAIKILEVKNDLHLQKKLSQMGLENAKRFHWRKLDKAVNLLIKG